ncbi:MAG: hypothetical protein ABWY53_02900 [Leifsonia flava]
MTTTTQLRLYDLVPTEVDAFIEWWNARLVPARAAHGFVVEFAYLDRDASKFSWALSLPTDAAGFAAAEATYMTSPEREAAFDGVPQRVASSHVALVEPIGAR